MLAQGRTRLETWGSNLVRGIEYGRIEAPVKPDAQPQRTGCDISSAVLGGDRPALIEHCDDDHGYRLTVLGVNQDDDEKVRPVRLDRHPRHRRRTAARGGGDEQ